MRQCACKEPFSVKAFIGRMKFTAYITRDDIFYFLKTDDGVRISRDDIYFEITGEVFVKHFDVLSKKMSEAILR